MCIDLIQIGFKLGHTAIKTVKLVSCSLTAICSLLASCCSFAVQAVTVGMVERGAPFQLKGKSLPQ